MIDPLKIYRCDECGSKADICTECKICIRALLRTALVVAVNRAADAVTFGRRVAPPFVPAYRPGWTTLIWSVTDSKSDRLGLFEEERTP